MLLARQYLVDAEEIVQRYERHGDITDSRSDVAQYCDLLRLPDLCDTPGFFREAIDHAEAIPQENLSQCPTESDTGASDTFIGSRQSYSVTGECDVSRKEDENRLDAELSSQVLSMSDSFRAPPTVDPRLVALRSSLVRQEGRQHESSPSGRSPKPRSKPRRVTRQLKQDQQASVTCLYNSFSSISMGLNLGKFMAHANSIDVSSALDRDCDLLEILNALDTVDVMGRYCILGRRMLLLRLGECRDQADADVKLDRCAVRMVRVVGTRKVECEALDIMVRNAYPNAAEEWNFMAVEQWRSKYISQRKRIRNRLQADRNWKEAVRRLGYGVITRIMDGSYR